LTLSDFVALESQVIRDEVRGWAEDLYKEQLATWEGRARKASRNKLRPPTWAECLEKSREIRRKREDTSNQWNPLL
jgi:hypothetical protein